MAAAAAAAQQGTPEQLDAVLLPAACCLLLQYQSMAMAVMELWSSSYTHLTCYSCLVLST